jgi:hypothetical protein
MHGFVNADMVAYNPRADSLVVMTNLASRWLANEVLDTHERIEADREEAAGGADPDTLILDRVVQGLGFSDHGPFWLEGFDAVLLIEAVDIERHAEGHYHRRTDTVDFTYSRGGSQAAKAAELYVGLWEAWSWTAEDSVPVPVLTDEDILVLRAGTAVDLSEVRVGEEVEVRVGATNQGGTDTAPWSISLDVLDYDRGLLRTFDSETIPGPIPAGGRARVVLLWTPAESERGAVRLAATVGTGSGLRRAERLVAVGGVPGEIGRVFMAPNPILPDFDYRTASVTYELTQGGAVRISILGLDGRLLAGKDLSFDPVFPRPGTDVGLGTVPLGEILQGVDLAPGLYLARVELFEASGSGTADVEIAKFALLR